MAGDYWRYMENIMKNKIFLVHTAYENKKEVLEKTLPGAIYNDEDYTIILNNKIYDVYKCEIFSIHIKNYIRDMCAYRLQEHITNRST